MDSRAPEPQAGTLLALAAGAAGLVAQLGVLPCNDVWWHLATARLIVRDGAIPTVDTFTFTEAGQPYLNQPWLAQLLLFALFRVGGAALLLFANAAAVGVAYALLGRLAWERSRNARAAAWSLILGGMLLGADNWGVRPQTLVLPLFVGVLVLVSRGFQFEGTADAAMPATFLGWTRATRFWLLPIFAALWVNLHGSFALTLVVPALALVGATLERIAGQRLGADAAKRSVRVPLRFVAVWLALATLACCANPRGAHVFTYVAHHVSTRANAFNLEYLPPEPFSLGGGAVFAVGLGAVVLTLRSRRLPALAEILVFVFLLVQAVLARRAIIWFGLFAPPFLALRLAPLLKSKETDSPRLRLDWRPLTGLAIAVVLTSPWLRVHLFHGARGRLLDAATPVAAVEKLRTDPAAPSRLFHDLEYGCYLEWAAPQQKVFIDTRFDFHTGPLLEDYVAISRGSLARLDAYDIDGVLLDKVEERALVDVIRKDPAWEVRVDDDISLYAVKRKAR
ncbi:MAG: hypothetical protein HOO96_41565 [Polyangiaceae bacterium]|nr:hypothetical protein [Polyangiaceae bacterium]